MNIEKLVNFSAQAAVRAVIISGMLFGLSLLAVSLWFLNYNAPIIPQCPITEGSNTVIAADVDGVVVQADIRNGWLPEVQLIEVTPASTAGESLTAQLRIFDTIPQGKHRLELTFANNDAPIPQTANCKVLVNVTKDTVLGQTRTYYTIKPHGRAAIAPNLLNSLTARVPLGMVPGLLTIALAVWSGARFVQGFYDLKELKIGFRFMKFRLIGQPNPKKPGSPIVTGVLQEGDEQIQKLGGPAMLFLRADTFSAVVLEKAGKLTRVARAPGDCHLKPFEKVWDTLDMRPQHWATEAAAITKDGIPITYAVEVQFRICDDDKAVLKAATLGLDLLGLTLGDIEFDGQVLTQWFQEWQTKRNRRIAPLKAKAEINTIKARELALNEIRQQTLKQTLETLQKLIQDQPENKEFYQNYILLSFVEVVRSMNMNKATPLPKDGLQTTIEDLNKIIRPTPPVNKEEEEVGTKGVIHWAHATIINYGYTATSLTQYDEHPTACRYHRVEWASPGVGRAGIGQDARFNASYCMDAV